MRVAVLQARCGEPACSGGVCCIGQCLAPVGLLWRCVAQVEAVLRAGPASREGELCVQEVFSLLDVLHQWVAEARAPPLPGTVAATSTGDGVRPCSRSSTLPQQLPAHAQALISPMFPHAKR